MVRFHKKVPFSSYNSYPPDDLKSMNSTSLLIKNIKTYLMSRDVKKQVYAIAVIQRHLRNKGSELTADVLMYTDIPGLLCDVMNNHNSSLIRQVIVCLLELSKNKSFYEEKHAAIVIETTSRTLKILINDVSNKTVIFYGLKLLSQILSMYVAALTYLYIYLLL